MSRRNKSSKLRIITTRLTLSVHKNKPNSHFKWFKNIRLSYLEKVLFFFFLLSPKKKFLFSNPSWIKNNCYVNFPYFLELCKKVLKIIMVTLKESKSNTWNRLCIPFIYLFKSIVTSLQKLKKVNFHLMRKLKSTEKYKIIYGTYLPLYQTSNIRYIN